MKCAVDKLEKEYQAELSAVDAAIETLWSDGKAKEAERVATDFSVKHGEALAGEWLRFYGFLFQMFHDGDITTASQDDPQCNCEVDEVGYSQAWRDRIVDEAGELYSLPGATHGEGEPLAMAKESLSGV